ncbi:hypothetical protein [Streptomyces sp. NPDC002530]
MRRLRAGRRELRRLLGERRFGVRGRVGLRRGVRFELRGRRVQLWRRRVELRGRQQLRIELRRRFLSAPASAW